MRGMGASANGHRSGSSSGFGQAGSLLKPEDLETLQRIGQPRRVQAGTLLVGVGARVGEVFLVRQGTVHLAVRLEGGGRSTVAVVGAGGIVCDIPLFCRQPMPYDALSVTDATVLAVDAGRFLRLLGGHPDLAVRWVASVAARSERTRRRMTAMLLRPLIGQVAAVLLEERTPAGHGTWTVELSHRTIAELLGARRQSVSRVFAELRDQGVVSTRYRTAVLHDLGALADLAGYRSEWLDGSVGRAGLDG